MFQEKAIEAVVDAGINPTDLEGTRTGVLMDFFSVKMKILVL
ncbi:unnamed protein product [Callosobruchus maculatus]|uniref:Uncharacterized protein n=1 Tax=Callosobruchus maculatus TaxID=64391 RepID=A0A653CTB9_CALMS|nr:unnamed protein product [Callosobruchus maculatus]